VDVRNQGDQMVYQAERTLEEAGDKLSDADKGPVKEKIEKLKTALQGTDSAAIKAATEELTQAFYKLSEKLYQANGANPQGTPGGDPGAGYAGPNPGGSAGGNYQDADYEVVDDDDNK